MTKKTDPRLIQFGNHVRNLREKKGLSQDEVSTNSEKLSKATISDIERGKRNAATTTLIDLAKGLKVHPKEILNFDITDEG
ncbi:helix-turn-helix domain-containing protein [Flavobacterium beibuense]|uniref:helix-turn-helix domain-containing protein n=1 Tax=Flavobacterium beibuense TaxID=657326 RepID=UPI003A92255A